MEQTTQNKITTKTKDGETLGVGHIMPIEAVYIYERPDGSIIKVKEYEAIRIHKKFKFLGRSDGVQYAKDIKAIQDNFQQMTKEEWRKAILDADARQLELAKQDLTPPKLQPLNLGLTRRPDGTGQIQISARDTVENG